MGGAAKLGIGAALLAILAVGSMVAFVGLALLGAIFGGHRSAPPDPGPLVPPEFEPWLRRAGATCPQVPPSLLAAQIEVESGFDTGAISPAGALGASQFMPGTWDTWGRAVADDGELTDAPGDPHAIPDALLAQGNFMCSIAARVDAWIAEGLVAAPNGPTELYLAGYNAGPESVLEAGGFPTSGDPLDPTSHAGQTVPYAARIIDAEPQYRFLN
jgi:hypothetical protein